MRRLAIAAGVLLVLVVAFGIYLRLFTGSPVPFIGGGHLSGELVEAPVEDWSFIPASQHNLDVESRAGWLPFSTSPWFMVVDGRLHLLLPSLFGDDLKRRIDADPRLWVRVDGRIHPVEAIAVDDDADIDRLLAPLLRRQMAVEIEGEVHRRRSALDAQLWVYRLESR